MEIDEDRKANCWVRKVMELVVFQNFVLLICAIGGKYCRDGNVIEIPDDYHEYVLYVIGGFGIFHVLLCLLLFCKPMTRSKNPLNCMMFTVLTFFAALVTFLIPLYANIIDGIAGLGGVVFTSVFIIFLASVCSSKDVTRWYLSIFTIAFCLAATTTILYVSYAANPNISADVETGLRLIGLVPNILTILTVPFLLAYFVCRREGYCGEPVEAALHILYPWLILYDPFTKCDCGY